jgi:ABC-type uncharacterized transport system permease subunit
MIIERRDSVSALRSGLAPVWAILAMLVICSALVLWTGASLPHAYAMLFKGAFGSAFAINETLTRSIPLMFTGLAVAVAFRAKFYNIGAEGQLYAGALAAVFFGTGLVTLPPILMIPFLMVAGAVAGGALLIIPVLLKTHMKVDEVVTTLLLNFVVLLVVSYLIEGPWKDPMALGWPQTASIIDEGVLPTLMAKGRLHLGLIIALGVTLVVWAMMRFTVLGYEIRAVGFNASAAGFSGVSVNRTVIITALISGGLAGLAGVSETTGLKGYLTLDLSPGFGYTGIAVAMLAQLNPLGVIPAAIFLSAVYVGSDAMSRAVNIPTYIADVMVGVSVLAVLVSVMLAQFTIRWRA